MKSKVHFFETLCALYLSCSEEDFGHSKSEVIVSHSHGSEQGLTEQPRFKASQLLGKDGFVPEAKVEDHPHAMYVHVHCYMYVYKYYYANITYTLYESTMYNVREYVCTV